MHSQKLTLAAMDEGVQTWGGQGGGSGGRDTESPSLARLGDCGGTDLMAQVKKDGRVWAVFWKERQSLSVERKRQGHVKESA